MKVEFGTKAETLERLAACVTQGRVLPQERFTVGEWHTGGAAVLERLRQSAWAKDAVIVRSSGVAEDQAAESLAGHFHSVLDVCGEKEISSAVADVIAAFSDNHGEDQVFIQPMVGQVQLSGVAFTRDPRNGGFYDVINFDESGSTDTVTSGRSNDLATICLDKTHELVDGHQFCGLVKLLRELELLLGCDALDVEFALSGDQWHLLQVRPLVLVEKPALDIAAHQETLQRISKKVASLSKPHPYLHGTRSVFGIMPDWNPAEIIGVRPRPLALSTYKELVTDNVWAYQRNNYGYRNLRSFPLLISYAGLPYIDVRVSFNSFIPADIEDDLAERLVNYYTDCLVAKPTDHDKVEFEIIHSCYTMDLAQRLEQLRDHGFSEEDCSALTESLRSLTNRIVHDEGLWKTDIDKLHKLQERQEIIAHSDLSTVERIYWLLEDCKRYGTLPFAGLARAGFIAVQMLKSLVNTGVLRRPDYERFMVTLETVSSKMSVDLKRLSRPEFLRLYGHLRPGTYDLKSPRYDEMPDRYFNWDNLTSDDETPASDNRRREDDPEFTLSMAQMNRLEEMLAEHRIEHGVLSLFNFIKSAIEGREFAKFVFTRSLSDALKLFGELGAEHGFSRDEMSYADIEVVRKLYGCCADAREVLGQSIAEGQTHYATTRQMSLPPLITSPEDVFGFTMPVNEPNFITLNSVTGQVVGVEVPVAELAGNILLIPSADPGFDWIFSHGVGGFITMFGGANSHMAIRAGELGIPAVIGAGEHLYRQWSEAKSLEIDCAQQKVIVLQ